MGKGKILAIDYGGSSIGLAVSDADRMMAFGRGTIKGKSLPDILEEIYSLVIRDEIKLILVGLPMGKEGQETSQTIKIRKFADVLQEFLVQKNQSVELEYIDESFSTFEANKILDKIGVKGREKKLTEDEMSAIILVHRYIDFRP